MNDQSSPVSHFLKKGIHPRDQLRGPSHCIEAMVGIPHVTNDHCGLLRFPVLRSQPNPVLACNFFRFDAVTQLELKGLGGKKR